MKTPKKLLEDYDVESAGAFDLSVVLHGYLRQNSDDENTQQRVIEGALNRWKNALEAKAAPEQKKRAASVAYQLGLVLDTLENLKDEMTDES